MKQSGASFETDWVLGNWREILKNLGPLHVLTENEEEFVFSRIQSFVQLGQVLRKKLKKKHAKQETRELASGLPQQEIGKHELRRLSFWDSGTENQFL